MKAKDLYTKDALNIQRGLRDTYGYNPETGRLLNKFAPYKPLKETRTSTGKVRVLTFLGVAELAPLVWVYHYGRWPEGGLQHKSYMRDDCRIENLAEKPKKPRKNAMFEAVAPRDRGVNNFPRNSTSGALGVHTVITRKGTKYRAVLQREGRHIIVGTFTDANEAAQAWQLVRDTYNEYGLEEAVRQAKRLKLDAITQRWLASREKLNELRDSPYYIQE